MLNVFVEDNGAVVRTLQMHFLHMKEFLIRRKSYGRILYDSLVGLDENAVNNLFMEKFGEIPSNLIFSECLDKIHCLAISPKININVLVDDIHHEGKTKRDEIIGLQKTARIFSTYGYFFGKNFDTTVPVYFFPHSSGFVNTINPDPIAKVLISGRQNAAIYPFRHYMTQMAATDNNIDVLKVNCPYRLAQHNNTLTYGKNYVDTLSKYLCCFTCDAVHFRPYILAKHFEILASGSLLLAGNPYTQNYFAKLGFIDGEDYISCDQSNVTSKISYVLDPNNRETVDKIRTSGYKKFCDNHTFIHRAMFLHNVLHNIPNCAILQSDGVNNSGNNGEYYIENYQRKYNI